MGTSGQAYLKIAEKMAGKAIENSFKKFPCTAQEHYGKLFSRSTSVGKVDPTARDSEFMNQGIVRHFTRGRIGLYSKLTGMLVFIRTYICSDRVRGDEGLGM